MPEVHIPLTTGQDESVDPKLMPQGGLTLAQNVRFRKDARLGSRFGYAYQSASAAFISPGTAAASAEAGSAYSVTITDRTTPSISAKGFQRVLTGSYAALDSVLSMPAPTRVPVATPGLIKGTEGAGSHDVVINNGYLYCAWSDIDAGAVLVSYVAIVEPSSGNVAALVLLEAGAQNVKLVVISGVVSVFYCILGTNVVKRVQINTNFSVSAIETIVATFAGNAASFDVAQAATSASAALVYFKDATHFAFGTLTTGVASYTELGVQIIATASVRPSICYDAINAVYTVVWIEGATHITGNSYWASWNVAGAGVTGKTAIDTTGFCVGFPVIAPHYTAGFSCAVPIYNGTYHLTAVFTKGKASTAYIYAFLPTAKPVRIGNGVFLWCVDKTTPQSLIKGSYYLVDIESPHRNNDALYTLCECACAQFTAQPYDYTSVNHDNRGSGGVTVTPIGTSPGLAAIMGFMSTSTANATGYGVDTFRFEYGPYADKLLSAHINGQIIFTGARMQEFNGARIAETGLLDGPTIITSNSAGGAIPAGTYFYTLIWEYYDDSGRRHQSPPAIPLKVVLGGASQVHIVYAALPCTTKNISGAPALRAVPYRTVKDGTVFYRCSVFGDPYGVGSSYLTTPFDNITDAVLQSHEILYTQGAQGGLSGILPNDPPPACKYIAAGNDRLLVGGLEDTSAVQWSKRVSQGEPMAWTSNDAFRANVDDAVTGVATMDGLWYVFTRNSVWLISGDGPDDNGGGAPFGSPIKLPSDMGCISHRSIVVTQEGIFYQGRSDRIYRIPRGQNPPEWIGQPVRDTLVAYPFIVGGVLLPDENCVYWACTDASATNGKFIIYDTRNRQWYTDVLPPGSAPVPRTLSVHGGKLLLDGYIAQTSAFKDDYTGAQNLTVAHMVATGDVRSLGVQGWGRARRVSVLGEYRSDCSLKLEISYDSGATYPHSKTWSVTGLTAGARVERIYDIPYPRGASFRYRLTATPTSPGEGFVFNNISHEVYPERGLPRLGSAARA